MSWFIECSCAFWLYFACEKGCILCRVLEEVSYYYQGVNKSKDKLPLLTFSMMSIPSTS